MIKLKGLQQRLALYMFLPVAFLLAGMGIAGFIYARNSLITQWGEAATLKLQRAAHNVVMRLGQAKEWLKMFHTASNNPYAGYIQDMVIKQLESLEGVARVELTWTDNRRFLEFAKRGYIPLRRGSSLEVTPPRYDSFVKNETVTLVSDLKSETGRSIGRLEVVLNFDYLIDTILASGWSEGQIIVIGTDGIWDTENPHKEKFGKFRLRQIIRQHSRFSAQEILNAITDSITAFRGTAIQNDDVTLVVAKAIPVKRY